MTGDGSAKVKDLLLEGFESLIISDDLAAVEVAVEFVKPYRVSKILVLVM